MDYTAHFINKYGTKLKELTDMLKEDVESMHLLGRHTTALYFETHITLDPVDGEALKKVQELCTKYNMRISTLILRREDGSPGEQHKDDIFISGRYLYYNEAVDKVQAMVVAVQHLNIKVRRYKIENTLKDIKFQ